MFPSVLNASVQGTETQKGTLLENLQQSFKGRFHNVHLKRPQVKFYVKPFAAESERFSLHLKRR